MSDSAFVYNIVVVGAGKGGTALIHLLSEDPQARLIGVVDRDESAPGMELAKRLKIPTFSDYKEIAPIENLHFIIDTSGDQEVGNSLARLRKPHVEVLGGVTARFMWNHIIKRGKKKDTLEEMLFQYQSIYDIGLKLSESQNLSRILFYTVEDATRLIHTPSGSIALFDERAGEMYLGAVKGFSKDFSNTLRWPPRQGGLTSTILNRKEPLIIPDISKYQGFDNPIMMEEGIRSVMATRLIAEGKIIGILYVDDFVVRRFSPREASLLSLLGGIAANIIDKARLLESTMKISITDDLTGLYNHRHFMQTLTSEIKRAERYRHGVTLVMIDIDNFKNYNDTHGHPKGNEVLRQVSALLREQCRQVDMVARYGGEEFAIIMSETSGEPVRAALNRLREAVATHAFEGRDCQPGGQLTISAGVATYPTHSKTAHGLIELADAALYQAKGAGKNRIVISDTPKNE